MPQILIIYTTLRGNTGKMVEPVVEGTPRVQTYDVCNSTFHKTGAGVTA